jgi:hypothetical protein
LSRADAMRLPSPDHAATIATSANDRPDSTTDTLTRNARDQRSEPPFGEYTQTGDLAILRSPAPIAAVLLRSRSSRAPPNRPIRRLQRQRFRRILQGHRMISASGRQVQSSGHASVCGRSATSVPRQSPYPTPSVAGPSPEPHAIFVAQLPCNPAPSATVRPQSLPTWPPRGHLPPALI